LGKFRLLRPEAHRAGHKSPKLSAMQKMLAIETIGAGRCYGSKLASLYQLLIFGRGASLPGGVACA
jgi:hypothetical protein